MKYERHKMFGINELANIWPIIVKNIDKASAGSTSFR